MMRTLILGAGKIGTAVGRMLGETGAYRVTMADSDRALLARLPDALSGGARHVDVRDPQALEEALADHDAVISACPYFLNETIAKAARRANVHYFDLTEDVATSRAIKSLSEGAKTVFMPQCGLAPGFVGIAAHSLARRFDELDTVRMRVGALPQFPTNALKYNLTWSTDGLINEYCNPCEAIVDGQRREVLALEGREEFALDGVQYEAFNTSGGLGTLCDTLNGRVRNLDYKTVRYPGHRDLMKVLLNDLRLSVRRDLLREVLEAAVPVTTQDVVLVFVTVSGWRDGRLMQESFAKKIYGQDIDGERFSAIQVTTAAGVCAVVEMVRTGALPTAGFVRQEDVSLTQFLQTPFARHYDTAALEAVAALPMGVPAAAQPALTPA